MPGDVLLLAGKVGAGKTHFARAIIQARLHASGLNEDVPSPTYTIVQTYLDGVAEIWHADLYRLSEASEIYELGLLDAFQDAICLVEWPEILGDLAPENALRIEFSNGEKESQRVAKINCPQDQWPKVVSMIKARFHV